MAKNPNQELVWQGRIHVGDEPGVFGDALYAGLAAELPLTVHRSDPSDVSANTFKLALETRALETFPDYPGHAITVTLYVPDPGQPFHFLESVVGQGTFRGTDNNKKVVTVTVPAEPGPFRLSVRLRCDTTVPPGLYDDFVWRRLSLLAQNFGFFASLGFPS